MVPNWRVAADLQSGKEPRPRIPVWAELSLQSVQHARSVNRCSQLARSRSILGEA